MDSNENWGMEAETRNEVQDTPKAAKEQKSIATDSYYSPNTLVLQSYYIDVMPKKDANMVSEPSAQGLSKSSNAFTCDCDMLLIFCA